MRNHLREGIHSLTLLRGNVAFLLLFVYYTTKHEISLDTIGGAILFGCITILNRVTVWQTYEHFVFSVTGTLNGKDGYSRKSQKSRLISEDTDRINVF